MSYALIEALVLSLAVSLDTFVACFGYGLSKIKIPFISCIVIAFVNTLFLSISVVIGLLFSGLISADFAKWLSFALMLSIGVFKFFSEIFKNWLSKRVNKEINFKLFNFKFILNIFADSNFADADKNKILSPLESLTIAIVLSVDQIGVGLSHGISSAYPYILIIFNFFICVISVLFGTLLGKKIASHIRSNLSYLSGLFLIILAVVKLLVS